MKTYQAKKEELEQQWYLVNAEGKVLGRLATELVKILKGKNKPTYTPHLDTGDFVIVVNAESGLDRKEDERQDLLSSHRSSGRDKRDKC